MIRVPHNCDHTFWNLKWVITEKSIVDMSLLGAIYSVNSDMIGVQLNQDPTTIKPREMAGKFESDSQ